jgi:hypothetical protein
MHIFVRINGADSYGQRSIWHAWKFPKFTSAITREKKTRFFPTLSLVDAFVQHSIVA